MREATIGLGDVVDSVQTYIETVPAHFLVEPAGSAASEECLKVLGEYRSRVNGGANKLYDGFSRNAVHELLDLALVGQRWLVEKPCEGLWVYIRRLDGSLDYRTPKTSLETVPVLLEGVVETLPPNAEEELYS